MLVSFGVSKDSRMTKVLLLSDTHSYMDDRILEHAAASDETWHAGDVGTGPVLEQLEAVTRVRAVYGNIDDAGLRSSLPLDNRFACDGLQVWMTHIAGYPGRYNKRVREQLAAGPVPDVVICGHSHILKVMRDKKYGHMHLNPGAIGIHGFHQVRTMLRFVVDAGNMRDMEVIEYPRKAN